MTVKELKSIVPQMVRNMQRIVDLTEDITLALTLAHLRQNSLEARVKKLEGE